jgi:hypothetical protein
MPLPATAGEGHAGACFSREAGILQSFPSGHATTAFALCTLLAERIGTAWSRRGFYGLGALTATRVRNNQHWPSDVFMGGVLGITSGLQAIRREDQRDDWEEGAPWILPGTRGLTVVSILR